MIFLDFEVFRYDWLVVWSDTTTRKTYTIVNDVEKLRGFYNHYKHTIMVAYNGNHYDKYILQGILAGFDPFEISDWIIRQDKQGWLFSRMLNNYPVIMYDCMVKDKGLKQLEASLGLKIKESSVDFNIDRPLTKQEIEETKEYCGHDVFALMEVFIQDGFALSPKDEFDSSVGIIQEFNFPIHYLAKTKAQLGCAVLGAVKRQFDDEFDIITPDLDLGKYEYVREWFLDKKNHWYSKKIPGKKQPLKNEFVTNIAGIDHVFAWGGVHASCSAGIYEGILLMCDFGSLYPNIMVEYDLVSRGVKNPNKYKQLLATRLELKAKKISREKSYKIVLNGSYGQMKFVNSPLYDPRNANNVCVHGQLIALYLIARLEKVGQVLNTNTDGVLVKVQNLEDAKRVEEICQQVAKDVRIGIDVEEYCKFVVKDVNNYIAIRTDGKVKAKGSYVKFLTPLEMSLNIVNKAIRDYYIYGTPARQTVMASNDILDFQIIAKAGGKYECALKGTTFKTIKVLDKNGKKKDKKVVDYEGEVLNEKCNRVFASKNPNDVGIFKKKKEDGSIATIEMTPEHCLIINEDVRNMPLPKDLDKEWYISIAEKRIKEFIGRK